MDEMIKLEPHPYANIFPTPSEQLDNFIELEVSIVTQGQLIPIVLYQGKILDGRRRYLAYTMNFGKDTAFELRTEEFVGTDEQALQRSLDLNNQRRHLSDSQRALAALRLSQVRSGSKTANEKFASEVFNVGSTIIGNVSFINTSSAPERHKLLQLIERDECSVALAYSIAKNFPPEEWDDLAKGGKTTKARLKQIKRNERERELSNKSIAASRELQKTSDSKVYGVIYIDPPWKFEVRSENGMDRSVENHYPTMTLDDIRAMEIPAADDCAMFMWTTTPHLHNAIEILEGWGFDYKTCYVWNKHTPGLGYWTRNVVEILLLGVKGSVPAPTPDLMMPQLIGAEKGKHSVKPEVFADGITTMFPTTPKLEMFARSASHKGENWHYWGNEVGEEIETITKETKPKARNRKGNGTKTGPVEASPDV